MRYFLLIIALFTTIQMSASYEFNERCQQAMQEIFNLRTTTARAILSVEAQQNPDNSYRIFLEHYCEAIEIIILEDESKYETFRDLYYERRDILDEEDEASPYHQLIEAEMMLHLGLAYLKFGSKLKGAGRVYSAYKLILDNDERFPGFIYDDKLVGAFNLVFANIPPVVRWAANMIGIRGDMQKGFDQVEAYYRKVEDIPGYAEEAVLMMNFSYKIMWRETEGYAFIKSINPELYKSTLVSYFYANLASWAAENDLALDILGGIDRNKLELEFYGMDYLTGRCKLNRLDKDAGKWFIKYLEEFPGKDYKKDLANRLSWHYYIHGNEAGFRKYRALVLDDSFGDDLRDRDREAIHEAELDYDPHAGLIKARLLFDGGYYARAEMEISAIPQADLSFMPYNLEYHYRKGRILQKTERFEDAERELLLAVEMGRDEPLTFATRAALALGSLYEEMGERQKAMDAYRLCIDLYDSDHSAEGIENKAEKNLERLEEEEK